MAERSEVGGTDGIHTHTLRCPDEAAFERVKTALREAGFLVE